LLILGHLEENESNMDAAIRETEEEAGIKAKDLSVDHNFQKVLKVYLFDLWLITFFFCVLSLTNTVAYTLHCL